MPYPGQYFPRPSSVNQSPYYPETESVYPWWNSQRPQPGVAGAQPPCFLVWGPLLGSISFLYLRNPPQLLPIWVGVSDPSLTCICWFYQQSQDQSQGQGRGWGSGPRTCMHCSGLAAGLERQTLQLREVGSSGVGWGSQCT